MAVIGILGLIVKVIEPGKLPQDKVYRVRCRNCQALLEFAQWEGKMTHDQRDGSFLTIKCPTCEHDVHAYD